MGEWMRYCFKHKQTKEDIWVMATDVEDGFESLYEMNLNANDYDFVRKENPEIQKEDKPIILGCDNPDDLQ